MSIIAGQSLTGKTTIVDFIEYCLGGARLPPHDEVRANVKASSLELDLGSTPTVIERSAVLQASEFATVWQATLDTRDGAAERRFPVEPTSDPNGLSQFVLAASNLDGVRLSDSVVKEDTGSGMLSIRDVFRVMTVRNERLDSKNLVYERENFMVTQKYRQTIEVMFGVYDNEEAVLAAQQKRLSQDLSKEKARLETLSISAERDHPGGRAALENTLDRQSLDLAELNAQLRSLDAQRRSTESASIEIRQALEASRQKETELQIRVRDRRSLLERLEALRLQYNDDRRKLHFLLDADRLFDPLGVTECPACLKALKRTPSISDGSCTLCHQAIEDPGEEGREETQNKIVEAELRALTARIKSLNEYIVRLVVDQESLVLQLEEARLDSVASAQAVDAITESPAPWLALRDRITNDIMQLRLERQSTETGAKAWQRVERVEVLVNSLQTEVKTLSAQRRKKRPDREQVVALLSDRFVSILADIGYPKLGDAYVSSDFVPYVRGLKYTEASSGGLVVIALAWNLALWQVAFEQDADAPGLLIIDSPQKNLGHNASPEDDFADASLVDRFYAHAKKWLAGDGQGAQLIVVDNTPPTSLDDDVVIRFTRSAEIYPYGLITNAVD
ncbi:ATP-binding protein [Nesterenkonia sp. DZ6]|uniref:ATP-binding protein n=1 Tax=Nesterenkonia sp. DZ6 TaxID=2901229 RepID=UPI001F4C874A|nr:ATP-binding protein [Nesterenkonia sp. DZ6]MCH8560289.1 AAA family ATPase [Nesterenkonia sp. DZ6]